MNIAVLNFIEGGVSKYRLVEPHIELQNLTPKWKVSIGKEKLFADKELMEQQNIIYIHSSLSQNDEYLRGVYHYTDKGAKLIVDIDDYMHLDPRSPIYKFSQLNKEPQKIINLLKKADACVTTTKFLAGEVKKYNKNVFILPNAISDTDNQFKPKPIESERVRIMWSGGSSHIHDIKLLRGVSGYLYNTYNHNKIQTLLAGFNTKVKDISTNTMKDSIKDNVWLDYEKIFTNNYDIKDKSYLKYLLRYKEMEWKGDYDKQEYRRIWTKGLEKYGKCYNHSDICLAPLENSQFNKFKSQLKIIEAGFHKKPIIVSEIEPYLIDIIDNKNGLIVPKKKGHKLWKKYLHKLIESSAMREDLGNALYETVYNTYRLDIVTKHRKQLYESLYK